MDRSDPYLTKGPVFIGTDLWAAGREIAHVFSSFFLLFLSFFFIFVVVKQVCGTGPLTILIYHRKSSARWLSLVLASVPIPDWIDLFVQLSTMLNVNLKKRRVVAYAYA